jgi:hypothetical protein
MFLDQECFWNQNKMVSGMFLECFWSLFGMFLETNCFLKFKHQQLIISITMECFQSVAAATQPSNHWSPLTQALCCENNGLAEYF